MQNRVKNLERDMAASTEAKIKYDALAPADEADAEELATELAQVEDMLRTARESRARAESLRMVAVNVAEKRALAATKTKDAHKAHLDVEEWVKVAEALAPDGIPGELLTAALDPVNATLYQASVDADWMRVEIASDMAITGNGRPYQLLSESEKWRVDAMIAQAVSEISGLKILMLDRVDVLDLPGRAQLFGWLDTLAELGLIDTALLFATLKALPDICGVAAYWVENGTTGSGETA
jgi:hypothetical protein